MELRTLRAFVEVVRQGGFSQAAKTLFTTQSNVSKAVKMLEEELGCLLLDRIGHRSTVTEAGIVVFERAVAMLAQRDDLVTELNELRGLKRGVLRLGLPPVGSDILFAPVLAVYQKEYPGIAIRLLEHGGNRLQELLLAGEIDLAGALLPTDETMFEWKAVRREPVDALIAADHPLAKRKTVRLEELAEIPFILFEANFALNQVVLDACGKSGFTPNVIARSSQIAFIIELAAAKLGVTFLPRMIAHRRNHPRVNRIAVSSPAMEWNMALIWRRGGHLSYAARAWIDLMENTKSGSLQKP
jgi:DNA-binding transcriptional LysR family regulator